MSRRKLNRYVVLGLVALAPLCACERRARPWEGKPDASVHDESQPFLPTGPRDGSWLGPLGSASAEASASAAPSTPDLLPTPTRAGGLWKSCAEGFRLSDEPRRDVERLGMLCGPVNGMRRVGDTVVGSLSEVPARHPLPVREGACYRLFAAAAPSIGGLNVTVNSVRGTKLATSDSAGRIAIVEADRPFCSFATETLSIEVTRTEGSGAYAVAIYQLPTTD